MSIVNANNEELVSGGKKYKLRSLKRKNVIKSKKSKKSRKSRKSKIVKKFRKSKKTMKTRYTRKMKGG